jgi:hypothetical protein
VETTKITQELKHQYTSTHARYKTAYQDFLVLARQLWVPMPALLLLMALVYWLKPEHFDTPAVIVILTFYHAIILILYVKAIKIRKKLNAAKDHLELLGLRVCRLKDDWTATPYIIPDNQIKDAHFVLPLHIPINFKTYHRLFEF